MELDCFHFLYKIKPLARVTSHSQLVYFIFIHYPLKCIFHFPTFHSHLSSIRTRQLYTILICLGPLLCSLFPRESNFHNLRSLNKRIVMQLSAQCETNGNNLKQIANWTPPVVSTFWARASVCHAPFYTFATRRWQVKARRGEACVPNCLARNSALTAQSGPEREWGRGKGGSERGVGLELLLLGTVTRPKYSRTIFNVAGKYWEYLPQMLHDI